MSRAPGVCTRVDAGFGCEAVPVPRGVQRGRPGGARDERDDDVQAAPRETASGDQPVAAVVAGPAQDEHGAVPDPAGGIRDRAGGGGHGGAGVLHEPLAGDPERLRPQVGASHRLRADRRPGGCRGPALPKRAEIHRQDVRIVGRQWRWAGRQERAGAFTAPARVAERYAVGSRASVGSDGWRSARPSPARRSRATLTAPLS